MKNKLLFIASLTVLFNTAKSNELFKENLLSVNSDDKRIDFRQAFLVNISAVGDYGNINVGKGLSYAPNVAFLINDDISANIGTNLHLFFVESIGATLPLMTGISFGNGATDDSDMDMGGFLNFGITKVFYDDSPEDIINFNAPVIEAGLRYDNLLEIRIAGSKQLNSIANGYFASAGIGLIF